MKWTFQFIQGDGPKEVVARFFFAQGFYFVECGQREAAETKRKRRAYESLKAKFGK
jgi:hypothetical protein